MPSHAHFKHSRGVQKRPHVASHHHHHHHHPICVPHIDWDYSMPQIWCAPPGPAPVSSVFDSDDCIWHYGTVYVKETVAVAKLNLTENQDPVVATVAPVAPVVPVASVAPVVPAAYDDHDDDTESVSSTGNPGTFKHTRSIAKQNQLKYLKDGMRLRHFFHDLDYWYAVFDAETNRIIRTPDGVAFDTLRQFARLHCNEVLGMTPTLGNVWTNPNFQYEDDEGKWHPLANLKH